MISLGRGPRLLVTVLAVAGLNAGCWRGCHDDRAALLAAGADLPALITAVAVLVLQAALGWLLLLTVLVALEPLAGRDLTSYAGCPSWLRTVLLVGCGVAAVGALAGPANAAGPTPAPIAYSASHPTRDDPSASGHRERPGSAVLEGLPLPDRTTGGLGRPAAARSRHTVLVRPGDSLWTIAATLLPTGASAHDVDRAWRGLYAENRSAIGPDPDLITPGTPLRLPSPPLLEDDR